MGVSLIGLYGKRVERLVQIILDLGAQNGAAVVAVVGADAADWQAGME